MHFCSEIVTKLGVLQTQRSKLQKLLRGFSRETTAQCQQQKQALQQAYEELQSLLRPLLTGLAESIDVTLASMAFFGYPEFLSKEEIMRRIYTLPEITLEYIATLKEPVVLLTPAGTLPEKMSRVDAKQGSIGVLENNTYFEDGDTDPLWNGRQPKLRLSIVEGAKEGIRSEKETLKEKYEEAEYLFTQHGAQHISLQEYAMFAQRWLFLSGASTDKAAIPDAKTYTMLRREDGQDVQKWPFARWSQDNGLFDFYWYVEDFRNGNLVSRPAVQVGEY